MQMVTNSYSVFVWVWMGSHTHFLTNEGYIVIVNILWIHLISLQWNTLDYKMSNHYIHR